jgi:hypothetical protein
MAQVGVKCVRGLVTHEDCRRCSAEPLHPCELPPDILEGMREDPNHRHANPDIFSPTSLLDCDRKHALSVDRDWYLDVDNAWPMLRGSLVHALMENNRYPGAVGVLRETEMQVTVATHYGPQTFAGQPDLVVVNRLEETPNGPITYATIVDYKSTAEIKHDLTAARKDHVRQINMYAYLLRRWLPQRHRDPRLRVEVEAIEIVYLDFKKVRRFTSAGSLQTRGKMTRRSPREYATLDLEPLHIFPDAVVERNIRRMIESKLEAREELPPAYEMGDEGYWRCGYCPVREVCGQLSERGL